MCVNPPQKQQQQQPSNNAKQTYLQLANNHIYICVCVSRLITSFTWSYLIGPENNYRLYGNTFINPRWPKLTCITQKILYRNSCLLSDRLNLAITQTFIHPPLYISRLFHRLKIGCFSSSLAELFLAPPIAALSVESRSVPAVVSTNRLLLIFNLWAAECTRCFLYFKWVFPVVNILMLWCMFAVFLCCFVLYVLCVYCAHFHSLHERPSCQNGILSLHPLWVFLWESGLILNECFL